jgi:precorrin-8X/cobalt-precorrin-8 methylmutase
MPTRLPAEILRESFRIIEAEAGDHGFSAMEWPVVRRMIHASGDLEIAKVVQFQNDAVCAGIEAVRAGVPLVTDVRMVASGINAAALRELNLRLHCYIDYPEVADEAKRLHVTRSYAAIQRAVQTASEAIFVIGNAPTALVALCEAVRNGSARPRLVLAMPVGFVDVIESKEQALALGLPTIAVRGRKGGSAMAAAAVNALLILASEGMSR